MIEQKLVMQPLLQLFWLLCCPCCTSKSGMTASAMDVSAMLTGLPSLSLG